MNFNLQSIFGPVFEERSRTIYARITPLEFKTEEPRDGIQGRITGGSINVDGSSAVRRTCSLSLVTETGIEINEIDWALKNKFKVEIGIENDLVSLSDIASLAENEDFNMTYKIDGNTLWINQGIYAITSFSHSKTVNNMTIQIQGRDKMSYLNGDVGGVFTEQVDVARYDQLDDDGNIEYTKELTIYEILKNLLCRYGKEKEENLIIDDEIKQSTGKNLLEYRGNDTLYFISEKLENPVTNKEYFQPRGITTYGKQNINGYVLEQTANETKITNDLYLQKYEYGSNVGYEAVNLIYPGELLANVGETITSILDKIIQIFISFEYFYDVNGKFHFQKKAVYMNTKENDDGELSMQAVTPEEYTWEFIQDESLFTNIGTQPDIANLKNDYSVWGTFSGLSGEIPIHYRLAIEKKPTYYKSAFRTDEDGNALEFSSGDYDWRELIYQMAVDYSKFRDEDAFYQKLEDANGAYYPGGVTGYEDFYIDMLAFWRKLYNPQGKELDQPTTGDDPEHSGKLYTYKRESKSGVLSNETEPIENISIKDGEKQYAWLDYVSLKKYETDNNMPYYIDVDGIQTNLEDKIDLTKNTMYYFDGEKYNRLYLLPELQGKKGSGTHLYYDNLIFFKNIDGNRASRPISAVQTIDIETLLTDVPGIQLDQDNNVQDGYLYPFLYADTVDNLNNSQGELYLVTKIDEQEVGSGKVITGEELVSIQDSLKENRPMITATYNGKTIKKQYGQECRLFYKIVAVLDDSYFEYMPDGVDEQGNPKYTPLGDYLAKETKINDYVNFQKRNGYFKVGKDKYVNCLSTINFNKQDVYQIDKGAKVYLANEAKKEKYTYEVIDSNELVECGDTTPLTEVRYMRDWMGQETGQYQIPIQYFYKQVLFNDGEEPKDYWACDLEENRYKQAFWIDFIGEDDEELFKYSRQEIGRRTKAINDSSARRLLKIDVPRAIFGDPNIQDENVLNLPAQYRNYFVLSTVGKSVQDSVDELLYQHLYCTETKTISCIPIYGLEPNQKVKLIPADILYPEDEEINKGRYDYVINKISIPLAYNGMMNLTLTKAPPKKVIETEVVESV